MISMMNMRVGRLGTTKHDTLPRERRNPNRQRRCHVRIRANSTPENEPDAEALEEARLEAIESRLRSTGSSPSGTRGRDRSPSTANQQQKPVGQRAPWKEGQLFPEGWERMDPIEKATELYLGERGILYWSACSLSFWVFLRVGCSGVPVFRCSGVRSGGDFRLLPVQSLQQSIQQSLYLPTSLTRTNTFCPVKVHN